MDMGFDLESLPKRNSPTAVIPDANRPKRCIVHCSIIPSSSSSSSSKPRTSSSSSSSYNHKKQTSLISPPGSSRYLLDDKAFFNVFPDSNPPPPLRASLLRPSSSSRQQDQEVVLRVSLHCKGCEGKVRRHISKMEGVRSFSIDLAEKKVTVIGDVTPLGVLNSVSKVKNAQFWPSGTTSPARASASF
ncbi:protein SODIUM POTASSIUM ROOT DEFECTIVE 1-like [Dioscorea cayenensis subsp. rotundata]|uniref:Protein SODIUM POTASSIUM ROOT DEFECTIVE 1-like n=1 Tax=Dioscorea cayennensis subsp. rotundata TaxID=55577 RepID=A0AB40C7Q9_DIOCR|nr:protein SODIUM POTASSIUM ROOT DEFECTIVE 1-like [Dioscorea cayenensis subsp. rotundata]